MTASMKQRRNRHVVGVSGVLSILSFSVALVRMAGRFGLVCFLHPSLLLKCWTLSTVPGVSLTVSLAGQDWDVGGVDRMQQFGSVGFTMLTVYVPRRYLAV